jgi:DNA polymerase (family 10)
VSDSARNQIEMPDSWEDALAPGAGAGKVKFPAEDAMLAAQEVCNALYPFCERLVIAGSLRRRKETVGDVELVYIPRTEERALDFFSTAAVNLADEALARLLAGGILSKRRNKLGSEMWGAKNKLALHRASGVPVDLFSATRENWWNYLVFRTGGAESNVAVASAARRKGWQWNPYGPGFSRGGTLAGAVEIHAVERERDVFDFVGMPWREPWERQ